GALYATFARNETARAGPPTGGEKPMFPTAQNTDVHRSFSAETVDERVLAAQQGNKEALADIVRLYEPLVRSIVRRMNLSWEDACQEGRLAVVEAVYRFDPTVGCYFGTYVKKRVW